MLKFWQGRDLLAGSPPEAADRSCPADAEGSEKLHEIIMAFANLYKNLRTLYKKQTKFLPSLLIS